MRELRASDSGPEQPSREARRVKAEAEALTVERSVSDVRATSDERSPMTAMSDDVLWTATGPISDEGRRCAGV